MSLYLPLLDSVCRWNRAVGGLCCWLLSLTIFSRFTHIIAYISTLFLLINNIPFDGYTRFYLSVHQLMDICALSTLWLLRIILLWTCLHEFLYGHVLISPKYILKSGIARSCGNSVFNILRSCQTVFQSGYILLHIHQ